MRKADELIQRFLDSIGQAEGSRYVSLFRSWREIAGERLAAHAQPVDVRGPHLVVEADHPVWVQMTMLSRGRIVREVAHRFPDLGVTGIIVRNAASLTERPERDVPTPPAPAPRPPSRDEKDALERIHDDDLRDGLERLRRALPDDADR